MGIIDDYCKDKAKAIDEITFKFLAEHGYKIEKPYTKEKAEAIARQLKENGKYFHYEPIITKTTNNDDGSITVEQSFIPVLEDIKNDKKRAK